MENFDTLINSDKPVLVDFFAEWCGPCKTMAPILKEVKSKVGEKVTILKVDIDKNRSAAQHYNIRSVPTLILFKGGKEVWKQSGVVPAQELVNVVSSVK
jgi:thioredoxin 1